MAQEAAEGPLESAARRRGPVAPPEIVERLLRQALTSLGAAAVGLWVPLGGLRESTARDESAARLLEDVWRAAGDGLLAQVQSATGPIGTNRVRPHPGGPVRGRLIATAVRGPAGGVIGLLVAVRTVEQTRFRPAESAALAELGARLTSALGPELDSGTGLLTWSAFESEVRALQATHAARSGCVLYGDLDQVHVLNKLAGFPGGDAAIGTVADVLRTAPLRPDARVCHLSGDRFTIYLPRTTLAQGRRVAEELCAAVAGRPVTLAGVSTRLSISFGVAVLQPGESALGQALTSAEDACRTAKDRGRGRVEVYQQADASIIQRSDDVLAVGRLRAALEAGRLEVFAQPIVRLRGDAPITHYELLVRLIGEGGVHVLPASFMSAATRYRMLVELDRAVIGRVLCRLQEARERLAGTGIRFSINLSGPTIGDTEFLEWLTARIGEQSVPGSWLQFELTETAAVANIARTQAMIRRLHARGVSFALDDFGTGMSSLAYLKAFQVDMLKLDGSFVRDLLESPRAESLVRGIAELGRGMGLETVAEGVESAQVRDRLAELGIDCAQGYLFGRPEPLEWLLEALPAGS